MSVIFILIISFVAISALFFAFCEFLKDLDYQSTFNRPTPKTFAKIQDFCDKITFTITIKPNIGTSPKKETVENQASAPLSAIVMSEGYLYQLKKQFEAGEITLTEYNMRKSEVINSL